jgi:hypothetical protein
MSFAGGYENCAGDCAGAVSGFVNAASAVEYAATKFNAKKIAPKKSSFKNIKTKQ